MMMIFGDNNVDEFDDEYKESNDARQPDDVRCHMHQHDTINAVMVMMRMITMKMTTMIMSPLTTITPGTTHICCSLTVRAVGPSAVSPARSLLPSFISG